MIDLRQIRGSNTLAPKNSPAFTGSPTAPTPAQNESDTSRVATVGFVRAAVAAGGGGGGGGGAASLEATDLGGGYVELVAVNTISTLTATDNGNGNVTLSLI
ncbi:MAG: hypothetical protein IJR53_09435 [Bacteroidales bacterium]|nr:hypothetical protein [Bacteroidales bacterium]